VVARDGSPLRLLKDCAAWQERHQKARRTFKMRAAAAGIDSESDESDGELRRSVKSRQEVWSAPRDQSSGRKHANAFSDSPDSDTHQRRRKSTHQRQTSSRKRAHDASDVDDDERPRQKGKEHRRGEVSADEEEEEHRRRKKAKKMHGGDHCRDAGKDSHRAAKPGPSKRPIKASNVETDSSESERSDTD
jgi:hypothetical protein